MDSRPSALVLTLDVVQALLVDANLHTRLEAKQAMATLLAVANGQESPAPAPAPACPEEDKKSDQLKELKALLNLAEDMTAANALARNGRKLLSAFEKTRELERIRMKTICSFGQICLGHAKKALGNKYYTRFHDALAREEAKAVKAGEAPGSFTETFKSMLAKKLIGPDEEGKRQIFLPISFFLKHETLLRAAARHDFPTTLEMFEDLKKIRTRKSEYAAMRPKARAAIKQETATISKWNEAYAAYKEAYEEQLEEFESSVPLSHWATLVKRRIDELSV